MHRYFHILHQLSVHTNLTVLTYENSNEVETAKSYFSNLNKVEFQFVNSKIELPLLLSVFPKKIAIAVYARLISKNITKNANGILLLFHKPLVRLMKNKSFDFIVYENIATLDLAKIIKAKFPKIQQIYDAHNFDTEIAAAQYAKNEISKRECLNVSQLEANLSKYIDQLWVCSSVDAEKFRKVNKGPELKISVVPNGTSIKTYDFDNVKKLNQILFVGSLDYFPNEEGLIWFLNLVWPLINHQVKFVIIGSGNISASLQRSIRDSNNIEFLGFVEDLEPYYLSSKVVVIPILSGSGTRLKVLEAMKFRSAIVGTSKGIEGILIENQEIIVVDNDQQMASQINLLLQDQELNLNTGLKAEALVKESFDWDAIGNEIKLSLK